MGERLVITIKYKDENIAAAYYQWGGYTLTACGHVNAFLAKYEDLKEVDMDNRKKIILALQNTGAGVCRSDIQPMAHTWFNFGEVGYELSKNRDDGMIALYGETIKMLQSWADECVTINFDDESVNFEAYDFYSVDELDYYLRDDYILQTEIDNAYFIEYDLSKILFSDFAYISFLLHQGEYWKDREGNIYASIK